MASNSSLFSLEQVLNVIGVLTVLWLSLKIVLVIGQVFRVHVLSEKWKGVDVASYGPWAVVTGATAGIGKAYAHELARRGLNVVLISRSMEKLKQVAAEIEEQHSQSTKVIQADFTQGSELYETIRANLQGLEIGILVNNVGQTKNRPGYFLDDDNLDKYIDDMVNCNTLSITKVFDDFFSQALGIEYRSKGIIVQSVMPLFVESNLSTHVKRFWKISAKTFARQALNSVGLTSRTPGCFSHYVQVQAGCGGIFSSFRKLQSASSAPASPPSHAKSSRFPPDGHVKEWGC
uniref:very-long-chain 3-oxoacyl-CoA reductase-like n=1 Tax=Euleptes europaea TaxID=460621 RepID=UPI0025423320|nr:very-long-chain 3-oxoacyl-CoA reductase-like [Euleptes europaea]